MLNNVEGSIQFDVPNANVVGFDAALIGALPPDVSNPVATITEQTQSGVPGNFLVTASIQASMSDDDLGKFVDAVVAGAKAAGATLVPGSGSLKF